MESKRLAFSDDLLTVRLDGSETTQDIEVPAGETRYLFLQADSSEVRLTLHLRHPQSRVLILGLVETAGESAPLLRTEVIHHAPETKAETLVRTLASDTSHPRYEGLIRMEKTAQGSESYLNHHSLLLGEQARSWTLPSLEILANEVKCSHAATLRSLTELDLFYPRSRGLEEAAARSMLIEAFLADVAPCRES